MSHRRHSKNKTAVKVLLDMLAVVMALTPLNARAVVEVGSVPAPATAPPTTPATNSRTAPPAATAATDDTAAAVLAAGAANKDKDGGTLARLLESRDPCEKDDPPTADGLDGPNRKLCIKNMCQGIKGDLLKEAQEAAKKIKEACSEGDLGRDKSCFEQSLVCSEVSKSKTFDSASAQTDAVNNILKQAGLSDAASIGPQNSTSTCPQYSAEDYRKRKKELKEEIKDATKEMADLKKDLNTQKKDITKEIQDAADEQQKTQKELKADKDKLDEDQAKQMGDITNTQTATRKQIRSSSLNIIKLRSKLMDSQMQGAMELLKLDDNATKAACVAQAQKAYTDYTSSYGTSTTFALRQQQKQTVLNMYNNCMKTFQQQRSALVAAKQNEQAEIRAMIMSEQGDMADTQKSLDLTAQQLADLPNQTTAKKTDIDSQITQSMQSAQTKMQSAKDNFNSAQQTSMESQRDIQERLNASTNELNNLGPEPSGSAKTSASEAAGKIAGNMDAVDSYLHMCCPNHSSTSTADKTKGDYCVDSMKRLAKFYNEAKDSADSDDADTVETPKKAPKKASPRPVVTPISGGQ